MNFEAAIFDMDGVITDTAAVHFSAWKSTFDAYLTKIAARGRQPFRPFTRGDYLDHVDGRARYDGVCAFLKSRGLDLPHGRPDDGPGDGSICAIGNRKDVEFNRLVAAEGVVIFDSAVALIRQLRASAVRVAVATSSKNSGLVLDKAQIAALFDACVDGRAMAQLGLEGKPAPDIFTLACARLGTVPGRCMIVEDAISGVQAGVRGGFGLVLGVARTGNAEELHRNGAALVVSDLAEISLQQIDHWFALRKRGSGLNRAHARCP